jgi:hypothetical protein
MKKNLFMRIWNALKLFVWAFKHHNVLQEHNFKCMSDLFMMILKVSEEDRPYVTHLAFVHHPSGEHLPVASIWIGAGEGAEPIKRIQELVTEKELLKAELEVLNSRLLSHNS